MVSQRQKTYLKALFQSIRYKMYTLPIVVFFGLIVVSELIAAWSHL